MGPEHETKEFVPTMVNLTLHQALTNDFQKGSSSFTTPHMKNLKFIKVK